MCILVYELDIGIFMYHICYASWISYILLYHCHSNLSTCDLFGTSHGPGPCTQLLQDIRWVRPATQGERGAFGALGDGHVILDLRRGGNLHPNQAPNHQKHHPLEVECSDQPLMNSDSSEHMYENWMTKCWGIFDQLESDGPGEIAAAAAAAASSRIVRVTSNYSEDEMAGKTVSPVLSWMIQHPVLSRLLQWWTQPTFKILLNKWGEDILPLNINMEPMEAENHIDSGKRKIIFHSGTSLILTGNNDEASEGGGFPDADHCLNNVHLGNTRIFCECKLYAKYICTNYSKKNFFNMNIQD